MQTEKYSKQLNVVIDYILANLDKPLRVEELSKLANLSPFHFHRIFTHSIGESLAKYILRKRLELSAIALTENESKPITNIAYEMGFNSVNVFCRNFKKHFGVTAEEYRKRNKLSISKNRQLERNTNPLNRTYSHYFCAIKSFKIGDKNMECKFEIKKLPALEIIYCRHYGAYDQMQGAFEKLMQWAYPRGLVTPENKLMSIYHDNPQITETAKLISDACLIVNAPIKTDGDINSRVIEGGLHAIGRFEIAMEEFPTAWQCIFKLLTEHGCQSSGLVYEIYHNNRDEHPERKWIVDICIPVTTK